VPEEQADAFTQVPELPPPPPQADKIRASNKGEYRLVILFILRTEIRELADLPAIVKVSTSQKATLPAPHWEHEPAAVKWYAAQAAHVIACLPHRDEHSRSLAIIAVVKLNPYVPVKQHRRCIDAIMTLACSFATL
jgi:hypothetical protein